MYVAFLSNSHRISVSGSKKKSPVTCGELETKFILIDGINGGVALTK